MSSDTENSTKMTEKSTADPIYDTNWCDMPASVKLKCIGKMEFKERLSLRCTAKAERSLVDSQKIEFQEGYFWGDSDDGAVQVTLDSQNGNKFSKNLLTSNETYEFLEYVWKIGVFENVILAIFHTPYKRKLEKYTGEISAKNVDFELCDGEMLPLILQKIRNGIESIITHYNLTVSSNFNFDEVIASPHIWIDKSSKIGSIFLVSVYEKEGSFEEFLKHFADRIVSKTKKRVQVRTNDPSLHILLERAVDKGIKLDQLQFFRLMVISAEMEESEYENSCKEWVCKMKPEAYLEEWECEFSFAPRPIGRPSSSSDEDS